MVFTAVKRRPTSLIVKFTFIGVHRFVGHCSRLSCISLGYMQFTQLHRSPRAASDVCLIIIIIIIMQRSTRNMCQS